MELVPDYETCCNKLPPYCFIPLSKQTLAVAALGKLTGLVFEKTQEKIFQKVIWLKELKWVNFFSAARLNLDFQKVTQCCVVAWVAHTTPLRVTEKNLAGPYY